MNNNSIILNGCLQRFREQNELDKNESELFELFCLSQITKSLDLTFEEVERSIVDGGNDGGIDSVLILINDIAYSSIEDLEDVSFTHRTQLTLFISQCKRENSFKETTLDKLLATLPELFNLEKSADALLIRFNSDLVEKGLIAREAWKRTSINGGKTKVILNYCCNSENIEVNGAFKSKVEQLKRTTTNHFIGATPKYENFSCHELLKLYQTQRNQRLTLTFKDSPLSTSFDNFGIGYVGTVKLADYKEFLTDEDGSIRDDLFESNIRHFQGSVDVNRKIKATVESQGKKDFWWLNNGITIIANNPGQVGKMLSIDNVQIVNGLQTSYSIYNSHNGSKEDNRSVLVKVIINEDKETVDNIIASTNSQNPVSAALLRATDEIQRNLELYMANAGYFYDRRKNFYKNQGKPAAKIFSIQTAAQAIESVLFNSPFSARSKPTSLIKEDATYHRIFNRGKSFHIYLNCCLLYKTVNDNWSLLGNYEIKMKVSNFKLHLTRILASVLLAESQYKDTRIETLNAGVCEKEKFNEAVEILISAIDTYQENNIDANLINMAKTKGLTDEIIHKLKGRFDQPV